jgi:hypothetical protein
MKWLPCQLCAKVTLTSDDTDSDTHLCQRCKEHNPNLVFWEPITGDFPVGDYSYFLTGMMLGAYVPSSYYKTSI